MLTPDEQSEKEETWKKDPAAGIDWGIQKPEGEPLELIRQGFTLEQLKAGVLGIEPV